MAESEVDPRMRDAYLRAAWGTFATAK